MKKVYINTIIVIFFFIFSFSATHAANYSLCIPERNQVNQEGQAKQSDSYTVVDSITNSNPAPGASNNYTVTSILALAPVTKPSCIINANPANIDKSASTTLNFTTQNANQAFIDNGVGNVNPGGGSKIVSPNTTTVYTLTVYDRTCQRTTCFTQVIVSEEEIPEGKPGTGNLGYCGNGKIDKFGEECDDGNTRDGDGCSKRCKIEKPEEIPAEKIPSEEAPPEEIPPEEAIEEILPKEIIPKKFPPWIISPDEKPIKKRPPIKKLAEAIPPEEKPEEFVDPIIVKLSEVLGVFKKKLFIYFPEELHKVAEEIDNCPDLLAREKIKFLISVILNIIFLLLLLILLLIIWKQRRTIKRLKKNIKVLLTKPKGKRTNSRSSLFIIKTITKKRRKKQKNK